MRRGYASLLTVGLLVVPVCGAGQQKSDLSVEYSKCIEKAAGVDPAMLDCISAETVRQDTRLNAVYQKLSGQLTPERRKQLQEAQRLWISYTRANCQFYFDPDGGTAARLSASECSMSARARRAAELQRLSE